MSAAGQQNSGDLAVQNPFEDNEHDGDPDADDEFPCRPCSRLSFNQEGDHSDEDAEDSSDSESDSDFVAHLLQRSRIIESPEPRSTERSPPRRNLFTKQASVCLGTESPSASSSCSESPSTFVDPFSDSPLDPIGFEEFHKPIGEPEDWSKPKFSNLPSPLSPHHNDKGGYTYRYTPPRHCYGHHGLSRHALQHNKWFWAVREEVWLERQAESDPFEDPILPYERWTKPPAVSPYLEPDSPTIPQFSSSPLHPLPPITVHPRRGDIRSLRDPYCMHIDRYFVGMPLWTMSKTLWMFDVHMALVRGPSNCSPVLEPEAYSPGSSTPVDEDDTRSCDSLQRSDSTGFSDDSDSTLVESDNDEAESSPTMIDYDNTISEGATDSQLEPGQSCAGPSSALPSPDTQKVALQVDAPSPKSPLEPVSPVKPPNHIIFSGWPPNWYRRWEVLLHLCFKNTASTHPPANIPSPIPSDKLTKKKPKFFVGDDDDETWSEVPLKQDDILEEGGPLGSGKVLVVVNRVKDEEAD